MDEQRTPGNEPTLKRPEDFIEDLDPDERESETVMGGLKLTGVDGETKDDKHKDAWL